MGARASLLCMDFRSGRHFLQIPGPTNVPDRVLRAIDAPTIDHRGPAFAELGLELLGGLKAVFATAQPVVVYPSSGTGAWEAALVNTLSPGDKVLAFETGHFATLWRAMAERLGLEVVWIPGDWRHGADPERAEAVLRADHGVRAVMVVHNETSTGVTSRVADVRAAIDAAGSDALLLVDTISSLGSIDYRHDEWGVDVTVGCSQKGLMLPAGLGIQRGRREGARGERRRAAAALLLGLEAHPRGQPRRLLAVHVGHEPALRPARGARHAARGGAARRFRAPPPARGGDAQRRRGMGPRGPVRRPARALRGADRGARARRPRRRRGPARDPRALRHVARRRPWQAAGPGVPDRPPRRLQRPDAGRDAVRRGDGPADRRRARAARRGRRGHGGARGRDGAWAARISLDGDPARVRQAAAEPAA